MQKTIMRMAKFVKNQQPKILILVVLLSSFIPSAYPCSELDGFLKDMALSLRQGLKPHEWVVTRPKNYAEAVAILGPGLETQNVQTRDAVQSLVYQYIIARKPLPKFQKGVLPLELTHLARSRMSYEEFQSRVFKYFRRVMIFGLPSPHGIVPNRDPSSYPWWYRVPGWDQPVNLVPITVGQVHEVYRVQLHEVPHIWRPLTVETTEPVRKTLFASEVNFAMELHTVPWTVLAEVNGELGSMSKMAPGRPPSDYLFDRHSLDPKVVADVDSFEFLMGNSEAISLNYHLNPTSSRPVQVFVHDKILSSAFPHSGGVSSDQFGTQLPAKYSRHFVEALKKLESPAVQEAVKLFLLPSEVEIFEFNKNLILTDLRIRAGRAILPD